jgi:hypothetical protein
MRARGIGALLGAALMLGATACDSGGGSGGARPQVTTTSTTRPAVDGALAIGELAPITGPVSTIASSFTVPVQLAVDEMNLSGGVNGKPVTVTVADDASAVPGARRADLPGRGAPRRRDRRPVELGGGSGAHAGAAS